MIRVYSLIHFLMLAAFMVVFSVPVALAGQTLAYPTADNALFTVAAPDDWELEPGEEEGDFFGLIGPTGAMVYFRAIPGTEEDMKAAIEESVQYMKDNFNNLKLDEPKDSSLDGQPAFLINGSGEDKEDKSSWRFVMAWAAMENGNIAEIWFAADPNDKEGSNQARSIVDSFKGR